jgi:hypothetical protein
MASYNIIVDDLKVRIEHTASGQKQSFPRSGYRVELRSNGVNIVEQGSGVKVFTIREAKDLGSITDNRTTAGATTPISTLSEIYDILDATATPFFFLNIAALAADVLHDPFLLQDGTINPASTAVVETLPFDTSTNKVLLQTLTGDVDIRANEYGASDFGVTTDAGSYGANAPFIYLDKTGGEAQFGWHYNQNAHIFESGRLITVTPKFQVNVGGFDDVISAVPYSSTDTIGGGNAYLSLNASQINWGSTLFPNSVVLGGTWGNTNPIDKASTAFAQELRLQGLDTNPALSFSNASNNWALHTYQNNSLYFTNDAAGASGTSDYSRNWIGFEPEGFQGTLRNTAGTQRGYFNFGFDSSTLGIYEGALPKHSFQTRVNSSTLKVNNNITNIFPSHLSTGNGTFNAGIRSSVLLGGHNLVADKSRYAFAENLEVQGGIAAYTVDPTTNGAWGARSIPDKAYVDSVAGTTTRTIDSDLETAITSGAATSGYLAATNGFNEYEMQGSGGGASKIVYFSMIVPADYVSGGDLKIDSWTTDFTNLTTWTATVNINGTVDSVVNAVDITPTADTTYQTTTNTLGSSISAGDILQVRLNFTGSAGDDVRIRRVTLDYTAN